MNIWMIEKSSMKFFIAWKRGFLQSFKHGRYKILGDYHVQSDTLLLADVFDNFLNMCLKIYELDPAHFLSAPGLPWQTTLKKIKEKLDLLTDIDKSLMVEKCIRHRICHASICGS